MSMLNETHDSQRKSWEVSANDHDTDFPLQNLPLGIFSGTGEHLRRFGIRIGDQILDVGRALERGLLDGIAAEAASLAENGTLNGLFAAGQTYLRSLRRQVANLLDRETELGARASQLRSHLLFPANECVMHLPTSVSNYTDFYSGIYHAKAAGALLTPENPLPANYRWVPIAYHGRASSIRASGTSVRRPLGQRPPAADSTSPTFGPCERLDFELEMGFYIGQGNKLGTPIAIGDAAEQIAGLSLLNDWSARDIQRWEMFPLGPFLSKNFCTTVSPWIVTTEALEPFRIPAMSRSTEEPSPLVYLFDEEDQRRGGIDVALSVQLQTQQMRDKKESSIEILRSNAMHIYWTFAQMVAHHSSGGCNLLPGDLIGTGTISGPEREQFSSMLELTMGGTEPISLPNGERRAFLENGDRITFRGRCQRDGFASIGFGECTGTVVE